MPLTSRFGKSAGAGLLALALLASACIVREEKLPETGATLEGTIKYGDEPVEYALIQVLGPQGVGTGIVGEDGRYRVENAPIGEVRIGVNTAAAQGQYQSKMMASGVYKGPEAKGKGRVVGLKFIQIPQKYYDPDTSGIKTTVNKGANTFDITIPK
jgi:hypothetical protein